jgi:hypothetical protein
MRMVAALLAVAIGCLLVGVASASRPANGKEAKAIIKVVNAYIADPSHHVAVPANVTSVAISTVKSSWGAATVVTTAGPTYAVVKKAKAKWKVKQFGSSWKCKKVPAKVRKDLHLICGQT